MSRMGQTWCALCLLSGTCLAEGKAALGCDCKLSECCSKLDVQLQDGHLSWLKDGLSHVGPLQQKNTDVPVACELLALAENADDICAEDFEEVDTICTAMEPDIVKEFPTRGIRLATAMGRFIGQGTCELSTARTCAVTTEEFRIDQWRRNELFFWEDTTDIINLTKGFTSIAPPNYPQIRLDQTCEPTQKAMHVEATWIPEEQSATGKQAASIFVREEMWQAGENDPVEWVCIDLNNPEGLPALYALYLKVGDYPCKPVPGLADGKPRGLMIFLLIAVLCCLCICIALVVFCCRSSEEDDSEDWDSGDES